MSATMSTAITRGVRVTVRTHYIKEQSNPRDRRYRFAYTIRIENEGRDTVKLESRHWVITHGDGRVEEVRGAGVVGAQPVLAPGRGFEYTSGCELGTPSGSMRGTYQMIVTNTGERFDATIAAFDLRLPHTLN
jgi:ApaG protein